MHSYIYNIPVMMQTLNEENCQTLTGHTFTQILSLSGLFGVHSPAQVFANRLECSIEENLVEIDFDSDLIAELYVTINLDNRIIRNVSFVSTQKLKGISLHRVKAQVDAAMQFNMRHISLYAYGNFSLIEKYTGYLVWGKYGYQMCDPLNIDSFHKLMRDNSREEKQLYPLLCDAVGFNIWKYDGFSWYGQFITTPNSDSFEILKKALDSRS